MSIRALPFAAAVSLFFFTGDASGASNPPLSGTWNIQSTGSAKSSGELLFRVTPSDGSDPVEVTVSVLSGTNDVAVARKIRSVLSSRLRSDRFDVTLGQGANVLVADQHGQPSFSLELLASDVENLRVAVQSTEPSASPTVQEQALPAVTPAPATPPAPGAAAMPPTPAPAPNGSPTAPPPANSPPLPNPAPPPNATGGAGQPASAPPPNATTGSPPPNAAPPNSTPGGAAATPPPG